METTRHDETSAEGYSYCDPPLAPTDRPQADRDLQSILGEQRYTLSLFLSSSLSVRFDQRQDIGADRLSI